MTVDVDVVIPVRNGGRLLRQAVDSALDQHGVRVRVLVVDDGSTDGAVRRLPRDPRVIVLPNAGRGTADALNTGVSAGTALYVARQDADDLSRPGRLVAQVAYLDAHPGIGLVATSAEVFVGRRVVTTIGDGPAGLLEANPLCSGSAVVRRDVLDAAGGFRTAFEPSEDYDCWLRCAALSGVAVLPFVGYRYRLSAGMSSIRQQQRQSVYADLARSSARARLIGAPDPVDHFVEPADLVTDDPAIAAWWAREFAALGARREAWRCARRSGSMLRFRDRLALTLGRPAPQAEWT